MSKRPKIHIFLGAPAPTSAFEAPVEVSSRPSVRWNQLELTWKEGKLRPATGELPLDEDEADQSQTRSRGQEDWTKTEAENLIRQGASGSKEGGACLGSLQEYLDYCFPAAQPEPKEPDQCLAAPVPPPLSTRTHYLSTWTLSQALMLRGRHGDQSAGSPKKSQPKQSQAPPTDSSNSPELFSPATPSPGCSSELFSPSCSTQRVETGGIVLEVTTDGILCSQETSTRDPPTEIPCNKRPLISDDSGLEAAGLRNRTTPLDRCVRVGACFSVLVVVVHPCHLKEVKVKSGPSAGTLVPLASIVVTDQSELDMKVVLWRRAAFWALTVTPGDLLLITGLKVTEDRWRGETVLQSTFRSKLLNVGHASSPPPVSQHVDTRSLTSLCTFLRKRRPLLVSLPSHTPQDLNRLSYASLRALRVNTLVNALLFVTQKHLSSELRSEAVSCSRSAVELKAVLTVEQPGGQQGVLLLWGAAVAWLPQFSKNKAVWDFHNLLVREGLTSDLPELHSTPWSSVRALDPTDRRLLDFQRLHQSRASPPLELDVDTLLSQKYSGEVELRVQVVTFHFQSAPQLVLDSSATLAAVMATLGDDITYTGCGRCSTELNTDANGIYGPCYPCLPHTAVRRFYRPGVLTVKGGDHSQLRVQVPPVPLQKILQAPPDKLQRSSAPGSEVKFIHVAAEQIKSLLSLPRKTVIVTLRSHFLCDENSIPITQSFTLLDLQFPT
ncbi:protein FAM35A isoform X1 [Oryzias latipes]|uniref:Shieldin complex subunit 2 n=1 Tax=Oryzias latipes TaxID=8090 RepID=H2LCP2_ORYLA|nr:protein FAM35A isoform X1 [Oryzias latipes]